MRVIPPISITDAMLTSSTVAEPNGAEQEWSATTLYAADEEVIISTLSSTVTITNSSPCVISWAANNLAVGTMVTLTTTGALPGGLQVDTIYYVLTRLTSGTFTVSETLGGPALSTTSAGSGTHTATARVHGKFTALVGQTSPVTITIATPGVVTWVNHGLAANTPVVFTTTGAMPTGITAGTTYYVISPIQNEFNVATSPGGAAINTTGTQSGDHTGGLASNYNKPPMINTSAWSRSGASVKWAPFDLLRNGSAYGESPMTYVITPGERIDSIAVLGVVGTDVTITMTSVLGGGTVYELETDLSTRFAVNWFEYFFGRFSQNSSVAAFDLPVYSDCVITVTVEGAGDVEIGAIVIGMNEYLGETQYEAENDVLNFSSVTRDEFGNASMVVRRNVPKTKQTNWIEKSELNRIDVVRDSLNAQVAVWSALEDNDDDYFESFLILGFYEKFTINAKHPEHAIIALDIVEV